MYTFLAIIFYLASIPYSYYGFRRLLIVNEWEADGILMFVVFIPAMNFLWGTFAWIDSLKIEFKIPNKFFRIK